MLASIITAESTSPLCSSQYCGRQETHEVPLVFRGAGTSLLDRNMLPLPSRSLLLMDIITIRRRADSGVQCGIRPSSSPLRNGDGSLQTVMTLRSAAFFCEMVKLQKSSITFEDPSLLSVVATTFGRDNSSQISTFRESLWEELSVMLTTEFPLPGSSSISGGDRMLGEWRKRVPQWPLTFSAIEFHVSCASTQQRQPLWKISPEEKRYMWR